RGRKECLEEPHSKTFGDMHDLMRSAIGFVPALRNVRHGWKYSWIHIKHIQTVVKHLRGLVLQKPAVGTGIMKILSGEVGCAHNDRAGRVVVLCERLRMNAIDCRIDAAEISEPD